MSICTSSGLVNLRQSQVVDRLRRVLFRILPKHVVGKILDYACGSHWEGGISPRTFLALLTLRPTLDHHFTPKFGPSLYPRICSLLRTEIRTASDTEDPMQTAATDVHKFELQIASNFDNGRRHIVAQMFDCADFASREPSADSPSLAAVRKMCHVFVEYHEFHRLLSTTTSTSIADALVHAIWSALERETSPPAGSSSSAYASSSASASGPIENPSLGWCCFLSQSASFCGGEGGEDAKHHTLLFCDRRGSTIWAWHLWGTGHVG